MGSENLSMQRPEAHTLKHPYKRTKPTNPIKLAQLKQLMNLIRLVFFIIFVFATKGEENTTRYYRRNCENSTFTVYTDVGVYALIGVCVSCAWCASVFHAPMTFYKSASRRFHVHQLINSRLTSNKQKRQPTLKIVWNQFFFWLVFGCRSNCNISNDTTIEQHFMCLF